MLFYMGFEMDCCWAHSPRYGIAKMTGLDCLCTVVWDGGVGRHRDIRSSGDTGTRGRRLPDVDVPRHRRAGRKRLIPQASSVPKTAPQSTW